MLHVSRNNIDIIFNCNCIRNERVNQNSDSGALLIRCGGEANIFEVKTMHIAHGFSVNEITIEQSKKNAHEFYL